MSKVNDINTEFKEMDTRMKRVKNELTRMEAERSIAKESLVKEIEKLKELGITFNSKEQLKQEYNELVERITILMDSLKRKITEYEELKESEELSENGKENDIDMIDELM